jgi:predicted RNase H-like nuclease
MKNNITTFIGVDLAWKTEKNPSGIAVAQGNADAANLIFFTANLYSLIEISDFILNLCTENTKLARNMLIVMHRRIART